MSDFREFSEAYNDWLAHAGSGRKPDGHKQVQKRVHKKGNFLAQYITDPFWKKEIMGGYVDSEIFDACMSIAQNNNYTDSQKRAMIENKLRPWFSQMGHNNFREFSEAYNDYLMHGDTDMSLQERLMAIKRVIKSNRNNVPSQKRPRYDALTQTVVQQVQNGNYQEARQAAQEISSLSGSPSSMLFQYIVGQFTKPQQTYLMRDGIPRPKK